MLVHARKEAVDAAEGRAVFNTSVNFATTLVLQLCESKTCIFSQIVVSLLEYAVLKAILIKLSHHNMNCGHDLQRLNLTLMWLS